MGFARIKGPLMSRIGCSVRFKAPNDSAAAGGQPAFGEVVDEIWADEDLLSSPARTGNAANDWGDYAFGTQLIKWPDGSHSIRFIYYRRRVNEDWWEYASQMTVNADLTTAKILCEKTLAKKDWFEKEG